MAHFMRARTLVNPGKKKKKRKLSPLQKLYFGSKRQRNAVAKKRKNPSRVVKTVSKRRVVKVRRNSTKRVKRFANPSRIMTISLPSVIKNSGKKKGNTQMARRKKSYRRRKHTMNPKRVYRRRRRSAQQNPGVVRYRRHAARRSYRRRHNPGRVGGGGMVKFAGWLGGATLTHVAVNMLPATLTTGFIGYITTAIVAVAQGKVVGGVTKNRALGNAMTTGGLFYVGLKVIGDLFPSVGSYLPFGLKGMGIIGPSNFYVPQVNMPSSMSTFVPPAGLPVAVPVSTTMRGISGNTGFAPSRRQGRLH